MSEAKPDNSQLDAPILGNPGRWLTLFGPGAIVASLTIGSGELVFSSRGGALFGYRLMGLFLLICVLKWALVFATARHIVLSGAHPFQRWYALPGPAGWLPVVFLLLAIISFPIWVGFHAGTAGTLLASLTGSERALGGGAHLVWGLAALGLVMMLVRSGGYQRLEHVQMALVLVMLVCVSLSLWLLRPDLGEMLTGMFSLKPLKYPEWASDKIRERPVVLELATYVGVIGGSGYDYLAYVSYLRDKGWGSAAETVACDRDLDSVAADPHHASRRWVIAPLVDASLSFAIVFVFSAVFLTCGTLILRPMERVPDGSDLLTLQVEFVQHGGQWMRPVYFGGALLAMLGTLYGTIEVAPTIVREFARCLWPKPVRQDKLHAWTTGVVSLGGACVLLGSLAYFAWSGESKPPALIGILTPANLFTGVLACGMISLLAIWSDRKFLPIELQSSRVLTLVNLVGGALFIVVGIKAYADAGSGLVALSLFLGTIATGMLVASVLPRS